ncbi:MAG: hypothetical protein GY794_10465 [bacterium]|nr:hypothetical protein [bacterium]
MPERECKTRMVEIACPHQRKIVRANYPCDSDRRYLLGADGSFSMELIQCSQDQGRCAETLCAMHRFNRRGEGTWYPDTIRALPDPKQSSKRPGGPEDDKNDKSSLDQLY